MQQLTADQRRAFDEDGYLFLPNVFTADEVGARVPPPGPGA